MRSDEPIEILSVPPEDLVRKAVVPLTIVTDDAALSRRFAREITGEIRKNSRLRRPTNLIVPVGPRGGYREFVRSLHQRPLDLSRTTFFFMDEYVGDDGRLVGEEHPLSFRGFVKKSLVGPLTGRFGFDPVRARFPDPDYPGEYTKEMAAAGGIDLAMCGVGINGHVAFNEPEPGMTAEEFSRLSTRVVTLTAQTRTVNALMEAGGAVDLVPQGGVTVGMAEILAAGRIVVFMNRPWQRAGIRRFLLGEASAAFPVSLLLGHGRLRMVVTREVSLPPLAGEVKKRT